MSPRPEILPASRIVAGLLRRAVLPGLLTAAACGDGTTAPSGDRLELSAAGPTLQFAPPGGSTPDPLRVQVRRRSDLAPREGLEVVWSAVEGGGAVLGRSVTSTDSAGVASNDLTLGPDLGRYVVRAALVEEGAGAVEFEAWAVDAPVLSGVPTGSLVPGSAVVLEGRNFSTVAAHDVVLFGGLRARVLEATATRLRVEVPPCLPARDVTVTVSLGAVSSSPRPVEVAEGGELTPLEVGASLELDAAAPTACVRLPGGGRYLALLRSAATVPAARHRVSVRSLVANPMGIRTVGAAGTGSPAAPARAGGAQDPQGAWDRSLRLRERLLVAGGDPPLAGAVPARAPPMAAPAVGQERGFHVLSDGDFVDVRAVVRHVGRHVVLYEDLETPAGALIDADFARMAARFDDLIHPVVTGVFGRVPDLDGNERVVVLMTPRVNRLTPAGSDGFIGGFFYGVDLLEGRTGSNGGEVFYTLVPDPEGVFGDARPRDLVARSLPAILAHELQHMIHFNERVLELDAAGAEAIWLSEGLAQMAEDLVGREARIRGDEEEARLFDAGNHARARRFLEEASATSLILGSGGGSLAERGAGWLFVRYLEEHYGGRSFLGALTRTTRTGTDNVTSATGRGWADVLADWGVALFDGSDPGLADPLLADPRHRYVELRPRRDLVRPPDPYPLSPLHLGGSDTTLVMDAVPAAPFHALVEPPLGGSVTLGIGGGDGGATSAAAGVYLRVVRLR